MAGRTGRVVAASGCALAMASVLGLSAAEARVVTITSKISIKGKGLTFTGRVTSSKAPCKAGRKVTLHRTNGNKLGTATTNSSGAWKITPQGSAGITLSHFYATVSRFTDHTAGTTYICTSARSKTIPYHR